MYMTGHGGRQAGKQASRRRQEAIQVGGRWHSGLQISPASLLIGEQGYLVPQLA